MKFSTFFGKYTLCTLIYSVISIGFGIATCGVLNLIGKKAEKKDKEETVKRLVAEHIISEKEN